ncbi:MAG TPA: Mur ligase family protein [Candidatus Saccharimonadales bacterium]|nr:Mur ligase family protein [Candidatus Saccharimonadales bacterium]
MILHNFQEAHQALSRFYGKRSSEPYTLDRMRALMAYLGNPQDSLRVVHIAGTSGKTSTAYYTAALLAQSGVTVGLTVSPHVQEVNERVQINLEPLAEAEFCTQLAEFLERVTSSELEPSYFECMVAFAYWYFAKRRVDYAVVEVGLGGLLDGTNVITRSDKVCVITDIGMDHTEVLGDTLPLIARQKAGIIQPHNHVFMYDQGSEVVGVVKDACAVAGASLQLIASDYEPVDASMPAFQQRNFELARQAVSYVLSRDSRAMLDASQLRSATAVRVPARMERFQISGKTVIVDGSHNAQKLNALVTSIKRLYPNQPIAVLTAFVSGNDERWQSGIGELRDIAARLIITGFQSEQDMPKVSVDPHKVAAFCRLHGFDEVTVVPEPEAAYRTLLQSPESVVLIAGSFYLLNHIRPLIVNA